MELTKTQDGESLDIVRANVEALKTLFPEVFTEKGIDFGTLRQLLGGEIDDDEEKFGLSWFGKSKARQIALTPSTGTLRPSSDESIDWDTTQNLFIEGDNLEVLKLLQKSYAGKVKMIYIDPPYNTGNEFIYPDKYHDNIDTYLRYTGQIDEEGLKLSSNSESAGRFHANWLNMMYPRLKLARNLLRSDGLLFISIDDNEADNLKALCDQIFGEDCFIERVVWKNKYGSGALTKGYANVHEYTLVYSKGELSNLASPLNDEQRAAYKQRDEKFETRGGFVTQPLATTSKDDRPNLVFPIFHEGNEIWPDKQWIWSKERVEQAQKNSELVINETNGKFSVRTKQYLRDESGRERLGKPTSIMLGPFNQEGTKEIKGLFGVAVFDFPKPSALIKHFFSFVINDDDDDDGIYLDFFAGSCSSADALMQLNAETNGSRRFIMIQLPEACETRSNAYKEGYKTIADIGRERIRRAGKKIKEDYPDYSGDLGFKAFRLDSTNIKKWDPATHDIENSLLEHAEYLLGGRSEEDILYELLLKRGVSLTVPIESRKIGNKTAYSIGYGVLFACLDEAIDKTEIDTLGRGIIEWHVELDPASETQVVFRDSAFADDIAKTNMTAILEQNGIAHVRSL